MTPKEEQKQNLIDMMQDDEKLGLYEETLEEAKFIAYKEHWNECHTQLVKSNFLNGFEAGSKWQAERMYSEEEVKTIAKDAYTMGRKGLLIGVFNKWFEQFKKK